MFKKVATTLLVTSLLSVSGTALAATTQEQQGDSSATQLQKVEAAQPAKVTQFQNVNRGSFQDQIAIQNSAGQAQNRSVTGVQVQSANTSGPATLAQSGAIGLNMRDAQSGTRTKKQLLTTGIEHSSAQSTATRGAAISVQAQLNQARGTHFQVAMPSGLSIQHQSAGVTSMQFQVTVEKPSFMK
ncbi:MAG: hypothetical protein ACE3JP_13425 [Ectobacillus sp.]